MTHTCTKEVCDECFAEQMREAVRSGKIKVVNVVDAGVRRRAGSGVVDAGVCCPTGGGCTAVESFGSAARITGKSNRLEQLSVNHYLAGKSSDTRWCSGYAKPHYTQSRFKGKDEYGDPVEISGPWVRLLTP